MHDLFDGSMRPEAVLYFFLQSEQNLRKEFGCI